MKIIKATLILGGLLFAGNAFAWTCTHDDWKASECCPLYPTDSYCTGSTNTNTNQQGQQQGQGQAQGQGQSQSSVSNAKATGGSVKDSGNSSSRSGVSNAGNSSNTNSLKGGNTRIGDVGSTSTASSGGNTTGSNADNSGGNSSTTVDTGSHASNSGNDYSRINFIPSVIPPTPPSALGVGNLSVIVTACGPLMAKTAEQVNGSYMGFFSTSKVDLGSTDSVQQAMLGGMPVRYDETRDQDGAIHRVGSQAVITSGIIGVSGGRNLAVGGFSSSGNSGQIGGGSSSSMQRIVTSVQIIPCDAGTLVPTPVVYTAVEAPAPVVHHRRRHKAVTCQTVVKQCPKE